MTSLIYYAWTKHGISPSKIYNMDHKEAFLLSKLYELEQEERAGGDK